MTLIKTDKNYIYLENIHSEVNPEEISLIEAMKTRRTCRAYSDKKVELKTLKKILSISQNSASACNEQMWKFINIDDENILNELYLRGSAAFLKKAKQALLVLYDNSTINKKYADQMQSGASFISNFMLVAHVHGIGTCWVCHLPRKAELRKMFNIPKNYDPVALVSYGNYRGKMKQRTIKYEVENNLFHNKITNLKYKYDYKNFIKWILIEIYYLTPSFIRKQIRKKSYPYEKKFYNHIDE